MGDFKKLAVWQAAHSLAWDVYTNTRDFPKTEAYGLTSQLRRAASSIPANLAEGCGRNRDGELGRFLDISLGSASELDYHLLLSHDVGLMGEPIYRNLSAQVKAIRRMLAGLRRVLKTGRGHGPVSRVADSR